MNDGLRYDPAAFGSNVTVALADTTLGKNLRHATRHTLRARATVVAAQPGWQTLRRHGAAIRRDALARLPELLVRLEQRLTARGVTVHWAEDALEAQRIIIGIAEAAGARTVVKGKSMASEEIGLNAALAGAGITAVETDLGEYVVQLADEPPSHITAPALHKSRDEIGALFAEKLGVPLTDDPRQLTKMARAELRQTFLDAEMGITGANFAIAESGTLVMVENEGNIRMATTLPRVHVALVGIEKVVPTLADAAVLLRLLPRSATGQRTTSYVSLVSGPRREREGDGCEQMHVVLLDNGRSRLLADPELRDSLACIRCGACMNVCPVFQSVGGHAYGWTVPGPIGSVLAPAMLGLSRAGALPHASSLCGACTEICPVGIEIHGMLLTLRDRTVREGRRPLVERLAVRVWRFFMGGRVRRRLASMGLRTLARLGLLPGLLRAARWSPARDGFSLPNANFRSRARRLLAKGERR
jgi:L-lactate dehydrogenase complex protein LldF